VRRFASSAYRAFTGRLRGGGPLVLVDRIESILLLGLAAVTFDFYLAVRHGFFDLQVYYGAINYWMHSGGSLYDYLLPENVYGFTYPPFAALTMLPMAVTPWHVAIVISCIACFATTTSVIYWLVDPISRRQGWVRWYAVFVALGLATIFEPLRETFLFGQVNMLLLFLVAADFMLLLGKGRRLAGVGIGLATAIKLTPGVFILYLLVTRRWRAAIVASVTAAAATVISGAIAPNTSLVFWSDAVWNTSRVGALAFISNQSLEGAVARLDPNQPSGLLWLVGVLVVLAIWFFRVRRAQAAGDEMAGFAITGVVGCLISPVTWVHHLVWVGPALILLLDRSLAIREPGRRWRLLGFAIFTYALLCSRLVWYFPGHWENPFIWFMSNSYVWISLALLLVLPIRSVIRPPRPVEVPATGENVRRLSRWITIGERERELAELPDR
jgi:alpha-1,2-mannosyltransferase